MTPIQTADDGLATPGKVHVQPRKIVRRTRGNRHGPITRLMSPSDLGQLLKPFVFLDLFDMEHATFQDADGDSEFVLGSAAPHAHDLVLGQYSVHTSAATLRAGEQRLKEIQHRLQSEGRL